MAAPTIVTSILTGGVNNHQTTSEEANGVYTDFVSEGVVGTVGNTSGVAPATGGFAVNAAGTPDTTVVISTGVAYVNATPSSQNNQTFRVKCSTSGTATISANASGSTKYDWVYIKLDATKLNGPNTAGDDVATIVTSRSSSSSSDDGTPPTYGYPLAVVTVANGFSTITNSNIRDIRSQVALNTGSNNATDGWTAISTSTLTTSTGYNKGQKEYDITSSADLSAVLSPGMRLKVTRGVTPPTQCTDLESGSSQYAAKTSPSGVTFTDDFTVEAWIKLESYTGSVQTILSRYNGTSGWAFRLSSSGQIELVGYNAGAANFSETISYQSVPLGVWTHVAAVLDMSTFTAAASPIYMNGASILTSVSRGGTNPTALVQAGDLQIGRENATDYFDGEITDVRLWSAARTATQIRDNMNQQLVGNESNLASYYKLDGNFNDSTSNANNMTGAGGAVATTVDNPMNATEYAIIHKVTSTTITVFTGTDYNIPNITLSTPYYSSAKNPFGFSSSASKWACSAVFIGGNASVSISSLNQWFSLNAQLVVPTGAWRARYQMATSASAGTSVTHGSVTLSQATPTNAVRTGNATALFYNGSAPASQFILLHREFGIDLTAAATYIFYGEIITNSGVTTMSVRGDLSGSSIVAQSAYV